MRWEDGFIDREFGRRKREADAEFEAAWRHALGQPPKRKPHTLKRIIAFVLVVAAMVWFGVAHACPIVT